MPRHGPHRPDRELRVSDADREEVAGVLREHYSTGRLSEQEFAERVEEAFGASTRSELHAVTLDLPPAGQALATERAPARQVPLTRGGRALRTSLRIHLTIYLLVNVMLVAIWALTGGGYFWPVWPILGWGVGVGAHAAPVIAGVGRRHHPQDRLAPTRSLDEVAEGMRADGVSLERASAPDGTVTILFSDIEGSTELNARLGDLRWLDLLSAHHAIVRAQVAQYGGFEVKAQGDGFMIAFPSARQAVLCAQSIQRAIETQLRDHPDGPIRVRIGLHTGEALRQQDDFYGKTIVIAARITDEAGAGEILVSDIVKHLTDTAGDVTFGDERTVELKGLGAHRVRPVLWSR